MKTLYPNGEKVEVYISHRNKSSNQVSNRSPCVKKTSIFNMDDDYKEAISDQIESLSKQGQFVAFIDIAVSDENDIRTHVFMELNTILREHPHLFVDTTDSTVLKTEVKFHFTGGKEMSLGPLMQGMLEKTISELKV